MKITKNIVIADLVQKFPQTVDVLIQDCGLNCLGCQGSIYETLGAGLKTHGFTDEQIELVIQKLNEVISKK